LDLLVFAALGIAMGLLGSLFIKINYSLIVWRRRILHGINSPHWIKILLGPIPYTTLIAAITCLFTLPILLGDFASLGPYASLQDLVNNSSFDSRDPEIPFNSLEWNNGYLFSNLALFMVARQQSNCNTSNMTSILRFIFTVLAITAGIPGGLYPFAKY
jgi:H+/Cl- antiporter ClcA